MLAALSDSDLSTVVFVLALVCLAGAAYMAYLRNIVGCILLVFVAIVCFLVAD